MSAWNSYVNLGAYLLVPSCEGWAEADEIVFLANERCNQENLIAQLKGGVKELMTPVDDLVSNRAYVVMASLA